MIKIEAVTLEEAYDKASKELSCSITNLETEVVQYPSNGFLGMFKKNAIIIANCKQEEPKVELKKELVEEKIVQKKEDKKEETKVVPQPVAKKESQPDIEKKDEPVVKEQKKSKKVVKKVEKTKFDKPEKVESTPEVKKQKNIKNTFKSENNIMDNFYASDSNSSKDMILENIKTELVRLFKFSCYKIEITKVEFFDENTVYIEFDGEDSALLIGKDGYRYKALSYMLFNWVNNKYNLMIRLEISSFLKNQEEMIDKYLESVIARVEKEGNAKTKPLNGILVYIALSKLRDKFPNKYVSVKDGFDDTKFIIINEFLNNKKR
jgi:spoIIIJ-associated protein